MINGASRLANKVDAELQAMRQQQDIHIGLEGTDIRLTLRPVDPEMIRDICNSPVPEREKQNRIIMAACEELRKAGKELAESKRILESNGAADIFNDVEAAMLAARIARISDRAKNRLRFA